RGRVIRPLIESRHREAVAALTTAGLSWLEDPSNRDPRFFRNRVRHALLPRLADEAGGDLVARLGRLARRAREAVDALDSAAVSGDRVRVGAARAPALTPRELTVPGRVELPEIGRALEAVVVPAGDYAVPRGADRVAFDAAGVPPRLLVRPRRQGDRFRPFGG